MTTFWEHLEDKDKEKLKARMPKRWKPPVKKQLNVKIEGKPIGLKDIDKDMRKVPRDTRRAK
ncbi:MAG TPA: hypothetical protein VMW45_04575 [Dehalococcoidia bacterium]|nr:hypothetical protein [Dehalococcoidia bacterium]